MVDIMKLKLFISYSHKDNINENSYINNFKKHITPLKKKGLIEDWYDREILPGEDYEKKTDNNLDDADIICLFISANFLSSPSCEKETERTLELRKKKGISVIPIILSKCGWLDDENIKKLLALPTDGNPISSFEKPDDAWHDVYKGLKRVIEKELMIKQLKLKDEFKIFLQDTEMLTTAHSQKEKILLDDIFVYPELDKFDDLKEYEKRISSEELITDILDYNKILIAGADQSSKTTLCKKIFIELRKKNFIPIFITDKSNKLLGQMDQIIKRYFNKQYEESSIDKFDKERIIPIIDDFHYTKYKEKQIKKLSEYPNCIITVDDIFCLNFEDELIVKSFKSFKINELKPSLRYELIKNWLIATDKEESLPNDDNVLYQNIDQITEHIDTSLGKIFSRGIMPAYPFYILLMISSLETYTKPLNQEITSQGHCYQALIYLFLRKQNVKNEDIDTYINFLTEFAFYIYNKKKYELTSSDFKKFMDYYTKKFNFPLNKETLLKKLQKVKIITVNSFNYYSFTYPYIYYFFVGKYLAEHIDGKKDIIKQILNNLHVNENAYISIFISHHSKNIFVLNEVIKNARSLFKDYKPCTLTKNELKFLDKNVDDIIEAVLPPSNKTPESMRKKSLQIQDELETKKDDEDDESSGPEYIEIRRAIKTVEVMGRIIKNRAGSLERKRLEKIFIEAMNVHRRTLTCLFEYIKDPDAENSLIELISDKLEELTEGKEKKLDKEELREQSRKIYWNIIFLLIFGYINNIIHSLGSNKLISVIKKIHNDINNPVTGLVLHGTLMWYNKNVQINDIAKLTKKNNFSKIAKRIMDFLVIVHCTFHTINYKERQQITEKLKLPSRKLPLRRKKNI